MNDAAWMEVQYAVEAMIKNLGKLAERNPEASVVGDDFNALLKRAQAAFPHSAAISDVQQINGVTTLADLFGKLSIIEGAVKAAVTSRNIEVVRRHNEEAERQWRGGFPRR